MDSLEDVVRASIGNLMLHAVTHRKENLAAILKLMETAERAERGLPKFVAAVEDGKTSNEQLGQMVRVMAKNLVEQAGAIRQLGIISLIYVSSDSFTTDAAKVAGSFGKGDEAIRALFKAKFGEGPR